MSYTYKTGYSPYKTQAKSSQFLANLYTMTLNQKNNNPFSTNTPYNFSQGTAKQNYHFTQQQSTIQPQNQITPASRNFSQPKETVKNSLAASVNNNFFNNYNNKPTEKTIATPKKTPTNYYNQQTNTDFNTQLSNMNKQFSEMTITSPSFSNTNDYYQRRLEARQNQPQQYNPLYNYNLYSNNILNDAINKFEQYNKSVITPVQNIALGVPSQNIQPIKTPYRDPTPLGYKPTIAKAAYLSRPGCNAYGNIKTNQDSFLLKESPNNTIQVGVFDGHGIQGHLVSQAIKKFFEQVPPENFVTKEGLAKIYNELSYQVNSSTTYDSVNSGSTCILVDIDLMAKKILSANLGDSRAILLSQTTDKVIPLTYDHKPDNPEEKKRIEESGGRIDKIYGMGPYRVWAKNGDYPGLAMSRSIGDRLAHSLGVSDIPEIIEFDMEKLQPSAIVAASDGVWEFMSNEDVKDIVSKYLYSYDADNCAKDIVERATETWSVNGYARDDITCVVVFFQLNK